MMDKAVWILIRGGLKRMKKSIEKAALLEQDGKLPLAAETIGTIIIL